MDAEIRDLINSLRGHRESNKEERVGVKDKELKLFLLERLSKIIERYKHYESERKRAEIEEQKVLITLIVSVCGIVATLSSIQIVFPQIFTPSTIIALTILVIEIIYIYNSQMWNSYINKLIEEGGTSLVPETRIGLLIKNFNTTWTLHFVNDVLFRIESKPEVDELKKWQTHKLREIGVNIGKEHLESKNTISLKDLIEDQANCSQVFELILYLTQYHWAVLNPKDLCKGSIKEYHALDNTEFLNAVEFLKDVEPPRESKEGFYKVNFHIFCNEQNEFELIILNKEFLG